MEAASPPAIILRDADERDVDGIVAVFREVYGDGYVAAAVYDIGFLKRAIWDDETIVLVAERDGRVIGTITALLAAGDHDDLIGESCRAAISPTAQKSGAGSLLFAELTRRLEGRVHIGFGETRALHTNMQTICHRVGWHAVGFQPQKGQTHGAPRRASFVPVLRLFEGTRELRRPAPVVVAPLAPLAAAVLAELFPADAPAVVAPPAVSFASGLTFERLERQLLPALLRIRRGRVDDKELFGRVTLSQGLFVADKEHTIWLVARGASGAPAGACAVSVHQRGGNARIVELFGLDEAVMAAVAREATRIATAELGAVYVEADVSAYAPWLQAVFVALGYVAAAYLPAFVFEKVERLDVVRLVHLTVPFAPGPVELLPRARALHDLVATSFADQNAARPA